MAPYSVRFGSFWGRFGLILVPFGPVGQIWVQMAPKIDPANGWYAFWVVFGSILGGHFGSKIDCFEHRVLIGFLISVLVDLGWIW